MKGAALHVEGYFGGECGKGRIGAVRCLRRDAAHPFTIDATGATFWFDLPDEQAPTAHFAVGFKECNNVIFRGATLDRGSRGHVEGRITWLDFANNRVEIELSPGLPVPASFSGKLEQRVLPFKSDGRFCAPLYALQRGGTHLKYAGNIVITGNTFVRPGGSAISLDSFSGGVVAGNRFEQTAVPPIELTRCSGIREEDNRGGDDVN